MKKIQIPEEDIQGIDYFVMDANNRFPSYLRIARSFVEEELGEKLSLADRMILRQTAQEALEELIPLIGEKTRGFGSFYDLSREASRRYIKKFE